jgi:hypothetical protein
MSAAAVTGYGYIQSNPTLFNTPGGVPFSTDRGDRVDFSNLQTWIQKADGPFQFFVQAGAYSIPGLGLPIYNTFAQTDALFTPLPVAYGKFVINDLFSIQGGRMPTLIGSEAPFTFQNININRGLLFNQENVINHGVQLNYADGPWSVSVAGTDGFFSGEITWFTGAVTYKVDDNNTFGINGGLNLGRQNTTLRSPRYQFATPNSLQNSGIVSVNYTYSNGPLTITPYLQFTNVERDPRANIPVGASTFGAAVLATYSFTDNFSLGGRLEYITQSGNPNDLVFTNLLYGRQQRLLGHGHADLHLRPVLRSRRIRPCRAVRLEPGLPVRPDIDPDLAGPVHAGDRHHVLSRFLRLPGLPGMTEGGLAWRAEARETRGVSSFGFPPMNAVQSSRYHEVYAGAKADPEAFWLEAAHAVDWFEKPTRAFDAAAGVYGRWFPGGVTNTCHNALDRHVAAGRGERTAIIYDSPVTGAKRTITYAEGAGRDPCAGRAPGRARDRQGRPGRHLHADGAGSAVRHVCLRQARRRALGRVRRIRGARARGPHRGRPAQVVLPPPAASSRTGCRLQAVLTRRPPLPQAGRCLVFHAAACGDSRRPRPRLGRDGRRRQGRGVSAECVARRRHDPALTSSTPSGTTGGRRAWCRDTGGHPRRPALVDGEPLRHRAWRVFWTAYDHRVGRRPPLHCLMRRSVHGATSVLYEGQARRHAGLPARSGACARARRRALFTAPDRVPPIKKRTRRRPRRRAATFRASAPCSWPASAPTPTRSHGREILGVPVIDHWWQTEPAGASPAIRWALAPCR